MKCADLVEIRVFSIEFVMIRYDLKEINVFCCEFELIVVVFVKIKNVYVNL